MIQLSDGWNQFFIIFSNFAVRYDAESGQIIKKEIVKLEEIEASLRNLYGVERKILLKHLWTSIQTFLNFPNGEFLLRHCRMDCGLIKVYQKCVKT